MNMSLSIWGLDSIFSVMCLDKYSLSAYDQEPVLITGPTLNGFSARELKKNDLGSKISPDVTFSLSISSLNGKSIR